VIGGYSDSHVRYSPLSLVSEDVDKLAEPPCDLVGRSLARFGSAKLFVDQYAGRVLDHSPAIAALKPSSVTCLALAIRAVCAAVSAPFQPNMRVSNESIE